MDEQIQNQEPTTPPQGEAPKEEKGVGGIIGIVIIVIILIVAGAYLFANRSVPTPPPVPMGIPEETPPPTSEMLRIQGSADTVSDIEADLGSTDLENLDAELDGILTEVNAAQ